MKSAPLAQMPQLGQSSENSQQQQPIELPPHGLRGEAPATEFWQPSKVLGASFFLVFLLGVAWLVLWWRGRTRKAVAPVTLSEWQKLHQDIEALTPPRSHPTHDDVAWLQYSSDISVLTRRLIGELMNESCEDWTLEEFTHKVHGGLRPMADISYDDVLELLRELDMVRFGGRSPSNDAGERWVRKVREWCTLGDRYRDAAQLKENVVSESATQTTVPSSLHSQVGGSHGVD